MAEHILEAKEGCTLYGMTIDGKDIQENAELLKDCLHALIDKVNEADLENVFRDFVQIHGKTVDYGYCDECGDYWSISKWCVEY